MKKKHDSKALRGQRKVAAFDSHGTPDARPGRVVRSAIFMAVICLVVAGAATRIARKSSEAAPASAADGGQGRGEPRLASVAGEVYQRRPTGEITFSKDIASIVWRRCAPCHHPGEVAPFSLLTCSDLQRRRDQIAEVISLGTMPPWLPDSPPGVFEEDRRLTANERGMLEQWIAEGCEEGDATQLADAPTWPGGWLLGKPDLVLTMPRPFTLGPDGRDIYRNFVIPIPVSGRRYVRAVQLQPGNLRVVHHAFMYIDSTRQSRRLATSEAEPGFSGMKKPESAVMPEGQFLAYQPGKRPSASPEGLAWFLEKDSDLVLQVHMNATGKPEPVQASIGFYFTDQPPTRIPFKVLLTSLTIDIPAGDSNCVAADSFTLPVDVSVLAVLPHAHYVAREMTGMARLPDGTTRTLVHIPRWDFSWQGEYRYSVPVELPAGTTLSMRYTYDNSTNNPVNPSHPPLRVGYGAQSSDEMAELWLQLLVRTPSDRPKLEQAYARKSQQVFWDMASSRLAKDPNDAEGHYTLGTLFFVRNDLTRSVEHYRRAIAARGDDIRAHVGLGIALLQAERLTEAKEALERAVKVDPNDNRAAGSLGNVYLQLGDIEKAAALFEGALRSNPDDSIARANLEMIRKARNSRSGKPR